MKKNFLYFLFAFLLQYPIFAQQQDDDNEIDFLLEGKYAGKNIVVINPSVNEDFCISQVWVNGKNIEFTKHSNSFEIPLHGFILDQIVSIQIHHLSDCEPIIVNQYDLIKQREFSLKSFNFNKKTRLLSWEIKELDSLKSYFIEQYLFGKWEKVKELGTPQEMAFNTFPPVVTSGTNFFRMKEVDAEGKNLISPVIKVKIPNRYIEIKKFKVTKELEFNDVTHYEIFTENGFFVKSGTAKTVDVSELNRGVYFVNYDGMQATFIKK